MCVSLNWVHVVPTTFLTIIIAVVHHTIIFLFFGLPSSYTSFLFWGDYPWYAYNNLLVLLAYTLRGCVWLLTSDVINYHLYYCNWSCSNRNYCNLYYFFIFKISEKYPFINNTITLCKCERKSILCTFLQLQLLQVRKWL